MAPDSEAPSNPRIAAAQESPSAAEARHSADLYIRTSWVDAALALSELEKVQCSLYSTQSTVSSCDCHTARVIVFLRTSIALWNAAARAGRGAD